LITQYCTQHTSFVNRQGISHDTLHIVSPFIARKSKRHAANETQQNRNNKNKEHDCPFD
jgi:hypothetical protein